MSKEPKESAELASDNKGPSLAELIETRRFLGREFLTWLWFESELFEQRFTLDPFGECELWLERQLTLQTPPDLEKQQSKLTGTAPSGTPEAREALRQGKLPTQARIVVRRDEQDFALVLDADSLALSGVKIPALLKGDGDDPFYERIQLIEEIEHAIESLYREFLTLRLERAWTDRVLPAMRSWMREEEGAALDDYRRFRGRRGIRIGEEPARTDERAPRVSRTVDRVVTKKAKTA